MKTRELKLVDRNPVVDSARGYGILLVFLGHLVYYDSPLFRIIFNFHMPLFFFLSGITFSPEKDSDWKMILKRIWNMIGIPFVFFTILGALICLFTGRLIQHSLMDWLRAGASFFHGNPYVGGSLWFLTCLAVVKFLFWAWCRNAVSSLKNFILLIVAYVTGCAFGNFINPKILLGGPLMCFSVPMAFFFFATGYYFRNIFERICETRYIYLFTLSMLCFFIEIFLAVREPTPNMAIPAFPSPCIFILTSLCGTLGILCLSVRSFSLIRSIGRYSLYYFLSERWIRELWFSLSGWLLPNLFMYPETDNPNLMSLSIQGVVITMSALILMCAVLVPLLNCVFSWIRRGRFG